MDLTRWSIMCRMKAMSDINTTIELVKQWFHDKGIIEGSNPLKQLEKTQEELTETRDAMLKLTVLRENLNPNDMKCKLAFRELYDGVGDTVVTLIGVCEMNGFELRDCLEYAYKTISKRSGKMIDGVFVKDQ